MHIFTVYTPTHQPLLEDFLLPSLQEHEPGLPITQIELQQRSASGSIKTEGFIETIREKYYHMWEFASSLPYGELVVCTDCDIQFFKPFADNLRGYMEKYDIVFQTNVLNPPKLNIGFLCMRWTPAVRLIFSVMLANMHNFRQEEITMNYLLRHHAPRVRYRLLPANDYWTVLATPARRFVEELVPPDLFMHHGNGALGTENKILMLQQVRDVVWARQGLPRPDREAVLV